MRIAYFECFSGISGDMILGSLLDAGLKVENLDKEIKRLGISGYKIRTEITSRGGLSGTRFWVDITEEDKERRPGDILEIIERANLDDDIKCQSKQIFKKLAEVEAKIHDKEIDEVHFHEIGGLDSIIDIVGSLIGIKMLDIEAVYSSRVHVGGGFIESSHGIIPAPSPATLELLKGVPIYSRGIEDELTTPTGAAILKVLSRKFGRMPEMRVSQIGYGAGSRELAIPNLLRVYIGETEDKYEEDQIVLIETNIDDLNPEFFDYVFERLLEAGALDVFTVPVFMKKNRIGSLLNVLVSPEKLDKILSVIFKETTTFGVRIRHVERKKLSREIMPVRTSLGEVKVKVGRIKKEVVNISPEYESCKELALQKGVPLKEVYDKAKMEAQRILSQQADRKRDL